MKLAVIDRLLIQGALPREGNFLEMTVLADIRAKLDFTAAERDEFKFEMVGDGSVKWDEKTAKSVDLDLTTAEHAAIVVALKAKDTAKTLSPEHLDIYRRFVLAEKS